MSEINSWNTFRYDLIVRERHVDSMGHMNNVCYVQFFEDARWQMITDSGYGFENIKAKQQGPIILKIEIDFRKEALLRQSLYIESQVINHSGRIGKLRQDLKDQKGDILCHSVFTIGLFDMKLRKLIVPTPEWIKASGGVGLSSAIPGQENAN